MKKTSLLLLAAALCWGTSCTKKPFDLDDEGKSNAQEERVLTVAEAVEIIKNEKNGGKDLTVLHHFTINDKTATPAIYAINYVSNKDTSFSLVYADKKVLPIIAYGEGIFMKEKINPSLQAWIDNQILDLEEARDKDWSFEEYLATIKEEASILNGDKTTSMAKNINPLISSTWGQGCFYNTDSYFSSMCPQRMNCGNNLTGSITTAVGQILNKHTTSRSNPIDFNSSSSLYHWSDVNDTYNWSSSYTSITAVGELMALIASKVALSQTCTLSTASPFAISTVFTYYGYSHTGLIISMLPQNLISCKANLDQGNPVIFFRSRDAFICDGYRDINYNYNWVYSGYTYRQSSYHINWGTYGYNDGWFTNSYNLATGMMINIAP